MVIVWDEKKRKSNIDKHGFDFAELDSLFLKKSTFKPAKVGRFKALYKHNNEETIIIFALRGSEGVSIVSMRPANKKERT